MEKSSFTDKQKLRESSTTKPLLTTNVKGTSLGKKHKRRNRLTKIINPNNSENSNRIIYISIIALNVNQLNAPTKRHRLAR